MPKKTIGRVMGVVASVFLLMVILACGSSGDEPAPQTESAPSGGDFFGGLVEGINRDIAAAAEETGRNVEEANAAMAEGAEHMGEATGQAEAAMEQAGEEIEAANEELAAPR